MPASHPKGFRDDVVAIARRGEAPIAQIAKDFGIKRPRQSDSRSRATPAAGR